VGNLQRFVAVGEDILEVTSGKADRRTSHTAFGLVVIGRSLFGLFNELVGERQGVVPSALPELQDALRARTHETPQHDVSEALCQPHGLVQELGAALELTQGEKHDAEVVAATDDLRRVRRLRDLDAALDVGNTCGISVPETSHADAHEGLRLDLLEAELLCKAECLVTETNRVLVRACQKLEAGDGDEDDCLRPRARRALDEVDGARQMTLGAVTVTAEPLDPGEQDLGLGGTTAVAGGDKLLDRLEENLEAAAFGSPHGSAVAKEKLRPSCLLGRPQFQRRAVEPRRRSKRVHGGRSVSRLTERGAGSADEFVRRPTRSARVLEGAEVVVRQHLGLVFRTIGGERLDPRSREAMLLGTIGPRDLAVGDVADEDVPERELGLADNRRTAGAADEVFRLEGMKKLCRRLPLPRSHGGHGAEPEDLANHGRGLKQRLLAVREEIEPRRDQTLDRLRQRQLALVAELGGHANELLRVEGISPRPREQGGLHLRRQHHLFEECVDQPRGVVFREG
jgi:hypothetical protein